LHGDLADLAIALEREGIPVLYLGDFFERSEVRDLLSLLSLACEGHGRALLRIARFDQYQIPLADVRALIELARLRKVRFPKALILAADADYISPQGKEKVALLNKHIGQMQCFNSAAWTMLMRYLFNDSDYVRALITDNSVDMLQRRLAIYQFLLFTYEMRERFPKNGVKGKRSFLDYVRRLKLSGEEKQLRLTQASRWTVSIKAKVGTLPAA
jgi:superfamily I DNA/RNA helicase